MNSCGHTEVSDRTARSRFGSKDDGGTGDAPSNRSNSRRRSVRSTARWGVPQTRTTRISWTLWTYLCTALCTALSLGGIAGGTSGCVQIDGGAVELSWAVRNFEGNPLECATAKIDTVRLCWRSVDVTGALACASDAQASFVCDQEQGASAFEVPTGDQSLWVEIDCTTGAADPSTYDVPAPIVRTVSEGNIVTLNSLLIVVATPPNPNTPTFCLDRPCTCPPSP